MLKVDAKFRYQIKPMYGILRVFRVNISKDYVKAFEIVIFTISALTKKQLCGCTA